MSKINTKPNGPVSPLVSTIVPGVKTYGGGQGAVSDTRTELFRLGVNLFAGEEHTYYENGKNRDSRFTKLVETTAIQDPMWTVKFLIWLRNEANIRTAAVIGTAHFIHARLGNAKAVQEDELLSSLGHKGLNRYVISEVLSRADEPGEFVSYWMSTFGKKLPKPIKRGIADSTLKLYNEYTVLKYNTASHGVQFADVLNLTHAKPKAAYDLFDKMPAWKLEGMSEEDVLAYSVNAVKNQAELYKYIIDKRYGNDETKDMRKSYDLPMVNANAKIRKDAAKDVKVLLDPEAVKAAGMTWEDVLSLAGTKVTKKKLWESLIDANSIGVMAMIRNLRNFEEAGISVDHRNKVIAKITNPNVIAKSRQFPYRFLSAFQNTNSLQYHAALETALELATQNIPTFEEGTLVLIDTSGSMSAAVSNKSKMSRAGAAALFGAAVAAKSLSKVDLVMFGDSSKQLVVKPGTSVLSIVREVEQRNGEVGYGTATGLALRAHYNPKKHKRVMIFTDGQSFGGYFGNVATFPFDPKTWVYAFDLAGYKTTDLETGKNRKYQLGGLSDSTFKLIPLLEQMGEGVWPWDIKQ